MSANTAMGSSSNSATTSLLDGEPKLNVGLQAVLRSLDVGLEDELTRYRRKRRAQVATSTAQTSTPTAGAVQAARVAIAQITAHPGLSEKLRVSSPPPAAATPASPCRSGCCDRPAHRRPCSADRWPSVCPLGSDSFGI
ncbi:MAG: hypothetical protein HC857_03725 [Synechococcales cyanobacterium RU_4_20]|nr:hypothetical protein [Synechococcales cyanobacterium RU_4_20]